MPKKKRKKKKHSKNIGLSHILIILFLLFALYVLFFHKETISTSTEKGALLAVERNYGADIDKYSKEFGVSASYLKALTMLETSGRKNMPSRYEKHVYTKLKEVQAGKRFKYEKVRKRNLRNLSNDAIKNLASSWGPFQIMGYKCIQMGIYVQDLRGEKAVYYGIKWIVEDYGKQLKKGRYKDAFHIHNTGRPHPKYGKALTYDPDYVTKGLQYMKYFEEKE